MNSLVSSFVSCSVFVFCSMFEISFVSFFPFFVVPVSVETTKVFLAVFIGDLGVLDWGPGGAMPSPLSIGGFDGATECLLFEALFLLSVSFSSRNRTLFFCILSLRCCCCSSSCGKDCRSLLFRLLLLRNRSSSSSSSEEYIESEVSISSSG